MKRFLVLWGMVVLLSWYPVQAARTFADGTSLQVASAIVVLPFTFCAWIRPTQVAAANDLFGLVTAGSGDHRHRLEINSSSQLTIVSRTDTDSGVSLTTPLVSANVWSHVCAVFATTSSRSAYLNGVNKVSTTGTRDPIGVNQTWIAASNPITANRELNGQMAHAALWSVALADAEVVALATGVCPSRIRPLNLVAHVPIWGVNSPELDIAGPRSWTVIGSPAQASFGAPVAPCTRP